MERIFIFAFATLAVCIAAFLCAAFRSLGKSRGFAPAACLAVLAAMSVLWAGKKPQLVKEPEDGLEKERREAHYIASEWFGFDFADESFYAPLGYPVGFWDEYERMFQKEAATDEDDQGETDAGQSIQRLRGYLAPTVHPADMSIFERPENAETPDFWTRHSVCDDVRRINSVEYLEQRMSVAVCGIAMVGGTKFDSPSEILGDMFAPFYATNSLILGTSDFWACRTDVSMRFVWKDLAYNRDPSNLVSFAAEVFDWGDVEFTYGNIPESGFSAFVQIDNARLDLTEHCAPYRTIRLEANHEPNIQNYLDHFGEFCGTNEFGELVWNYDTNEWMQVTLEFTVADEENAETEADVPGRRAPLRAKAIAAADTAECHVRIALAKSNVWVRIWDEHRYHRDRHYHLTTVAENNPYVVKDFFATGVKYFVESFEKNTGRPVAMKKLTITNRDDVVSRRLPPNKAMFIRPIELGISATDCADADCFTLKASLKPASYDKGDEYFEWSTTNDNLRVEDTHTASTTVRRIGNGGGVVKCKWLGSIKYRNGFCSVDAEGLIEIAAKPDDWVPTNRYFSVSADPAVVLFEPDHLDANAQKVAFAAPQSRVTVGYNGMMNGSIRLEAKSGWSDQYSVFCDNAKIDLPYTYSVDGASTKDFIVRASEESSNTNGVVFSAVLLDDDSEVVSDSASVVFAKVGVASKADSNSATRRHVFGPMETVRVEVEPSKGAAAEFGPYLMETNLTLSVPTIGGNFDVPISVIAPKARVAARARVMTESAAEDETFDLPAAGQVGAVVLFDGVECVPDCVSFDGLVITEGEAEPSGLTGYFAAHPGAAGRHGREQGAGKAVRVTNRTSLGSDVAGYFWPSLSAPLASGGFHWDIPVSWSAAGGEPHVFTTNRQSFALSANGDFTVAKFGLSATRGTNGVEKATH